MNQIEQLKARVQEVETRHAETGKPMAPDMREWLNEAKNAIREHELDQPEKPMTLENRRLDGNYSRGQVDAGAYALRGPGDVKDYRALFGNAGHSWQGRGTGDNFFNAVFSGRHDPRLIRSGMNETTPSDGGFLVPTEYASRIHAVSLENEIVMPRAFVQPMISNEIRLPAMNVGDHSSSLYGGFTASYVAEAGEISTANPKTRQMELNAKKLTGMLRFSSELAADIPGGENQIVNICGKGLSWYRDRAFIKGTGAGEPLGILNADSLVTVDKVNAQTANTIVYENLTTMMSRMFSGSFGNSVWIAHPSTIPQLMALYVPTGDGGTTVPVMSASGDSFSMLTRPVLFTEKVEPLGSKGDIILADLSQYVVGLRAGMRFDMSIHAHFQTDELLARLIERHDGQPLWDSALTLEDGTNTVSPFVTLAVRD